MGSQKEIRLYRHIKGGRTHGERDNQKIRRFTSRLLRIVCATNNSRRPPNPSGGGGGRGWGVGDPFINQTAGAEPRRAPLNRKPPGVFERNILQLCVSTSAVYLRATVGESREETERVASGFSSTPTKTALTLFLTFRASTSLISRSRGLSVSRAAVIARVLEICACGEGRRGKRWLF